MALPSKRELIVLVAHLLAFTLAWSAVAASVATSTSTASYCEIPISSKHYYRLQWPLIFSTDGELYATTVTDDKVKVKVADGAEVLLSCGPNYLKKFYKTEVLNAHCKASTGNFSINAKTANIVEGTEMSIKDLTCDLRVIEEVLYPVVGCQMANANLTASTFGYVDPLEKASIIIGETCYDTVRGITLWAHIKLGQGPSSYLRKEENSFLTAHPHPNERYKIDLFRGLHFDELYERIRNRLHVKETTALKISSYVNEPLLNNAQFQAAKKLGWNYFVTHEYLPNLEVLKGDIRQLSATKPGLDVYIGSHGVHTIHGDNGQTMDVYLHASLKDDANTRFPMPQLVWLLVRHANQAAAFAVFNDATITKEQVDSAHLCHSQCEKITWLIESAHPSMEQERLVCCSYDELKASIIEMPAVEGITELLV